MRAIKLKYYYKNSTGKIITRIFDMDSDIANGAHWDYISDCPLMRDYKILDRVQFTGLTDKNGVEIYEGDVVVNGYGRVCEITWHKFAARFDCEFIKDNSTNSGVDRSYGFRPQEWGFCIEVIGNVHQNPELLGDNNG